MNASRKESLDFDTACQLVSAVSILLALLALTFGPKEVTYFGMEDRMLLAMAFAVVCAVSCAVTLARFMVRQRALFEAWEKYNRFEA